MVSQNGIPCNFIKDFPKAKQKSQTFWEKIMLYLWEDCLNLFSLAFHKFIWPQELSLLLLSRWAKESTLGNVGDEIQDIFFFFFFWFFILSKFSSEYTLFTITTKDIQTWFLLSLKDTYIWLPCILGPLVDQQTTCIMWLISLPCPRWSGLCHHQWQPRSLHLCVQWVDSACWCWLFC